MALDVISETSRDSFVYLDPTLVAATSAAAMAFTVSCRFLSLSFSGIGII